MKDLPDSPSGRYMLNLHSQLDESVEYIRHVHTETPAVGIVLGSGLSSLSAALTEVVSIDGASIPHYPQATAPGHRGRLLLGKLAGVPVCLLDGRLHRYEGHEFEAIVYPIRLMIALGIQSLVVSNAAGGVNRNYRAGDIVILDGHRGEIVIDPDEETLARYRDSVQQRES